MEKWQEKADDLINDILDTKEKVKGLTEELSDMKEELAKLLADNNSINYSGQYGKCNFVDFEREGLIKDNVIDTVDGVNKGKIKKINMRDLTKDIKVHFINVRGFM